MRKYNYFDDDNDDIQSLISSFDAPKEVKKEEVDQSLKEIEASQKAAKLEEKKQKKEAAKSSKVQKPNNRFNKAKVFEKVKTVSEKSGKKLASVAHDIKERGISEEIDSLSKKKRIRVTIALVAVFLVFFAILVGVTIHSVQSENKRIEKFNNDAGKVCAQYITKYGTCSYENLYPGYGVTGYKMTGLCFAREIDFNKDNVSELLLCYDDGGVYTTEVWGYNHDKDFVSLYHEDATQTERKRDDAYITLYFRNNRCYIGKHSGKKQQKVELYKLEGSAFTKSKFSAKYEKESGKFTMNGKETTTDFERIRLSVLSEERAAYNSEKISKLVEGYIGSSSTSDLVASANNMQSAYYSIVLNYNQTYGKAEVVKNNTAAYVDGLAVVDLIDFNGDGTDELLVIYRKPVKVRDSDASGNYISKIEDKYYIEIYRYNGTKAILAYKNESISNTLGDETDRYYIIKKKNNKAYYCANAFSSQEYGRIINASSTIFKFTKGKFVPQIKSSYKTSYGYTEYYIDDTQVYTSTFREKGCTVPLFDGSSSYDENTYTVTYLQRKRLKADKLDTRVEDTINNIRKLNSSYSGSKE